MKKLIILSVLTMLVATACKKEDPTTPTEPTNQAPPYNASAEVNTYDVASITCVSAQFSGIVTSGVSFSEKGIVYATSSNPTISSNKLIDVSSGNTINALGSGLSPNTKYYYRAYIISNGNELYGGEGSFTTPNCGGGGSGLIIDSNFYMQLNVDGQSYFLKQGTEDNGEQNQLVLANVDSENTWAITFKKGEIVNSIGVESQIPEIGTTIMQLANNDAVNFTTQFSNPTFVNTFSSDKYYTRTPNSSGSCNATDNGYQAININITSKQAVTGVGYRYILPLGGEFNEFNLNLAGSGGYIYEGTITGTLVKDNASLDCVSDELKSYSGTFRLIAPNF